jgi:hypothetical protein
MTNRRDSWWSHASIANVSIQSQLTDKNYLKRASTYSNLKPKFFPGSENLKVNKSLFRSLSIDADSKFKLFWDLAVLFQAIILGFVIPQSFSFSLTLSNKLLFFSSGLFLVDILISFNTTVYSEGTLINSPKEVALHYLRTDFFLDLLSGFPFELFDYHSMNSKTTELSFDSFDLQLLLILKILKLYKLPKIVYQLHVHFPQAGCYMLIKLIIYFLLAAFPAHWLTCLYGSLYKNALSSEWIYSSNIIQDTQSLYLRILSRVVQTMTSVGYGEFVVKTDTEKILSILVMSITSGFMGAFVGAINQEIEKSSATDIFFRQMTRDFHVFMNVHKIEKSLRIRILEYLRYLKLSYRQHLIREQDIIELLSVPLREQIFLYTRGYVLTKVSQLKEFSPGTLKALGYKLVLNFFAPNDLIFRENEKTSEIFFIFQGTVSVVHQPTRTEFALLKRGNYFGEIAFFTDLKRTASAQSKNYSEVFSLSRKNFDRIIELVPKDFEKIKTLSRNIETYGISIIGVHCFLCRRLGHVAKDCSRSKCRPNMKRIIEKYRNKKDNGVRVSYERDDREVDSFRGYNIRCTRGKIRQENTEIFEAKFLSRKINQYNSSLINIKSENNQLFTLINDLEPNQSDSDDSERNFLNFSVCQLDRKSSVSLSSHSLFLLNL